MQIGFDAKRLFYNHSGLGNYSRYIVNILDENFPENEYVLFKPKKDNSIQYNKNLLKVEPSKSLNYLWRSKLILNENNFKKLDIFHGLSNELPFGISKTKVKSVLTVHDLIFLLFPDLYKFIDRKIYTYKIKRACSEADKIIAISEVTKNDLVNLLKIDSSKIDIIYQSCNKIFKQKYSIEEKKIISAKYNLPQEYILNVGTIEQRKNTLLIAKALRKIDFPLVLIGRKTEYANTILDYIKVNKIENRVIFVENVATEDLPAIYQNAKIFIYPSIYEGFGIPILEAFNSEIPVIVSDIQIFREVAENGALYVSKNSQEELALSIEKILTDKLFSNNLVNYGIARAEYFNDKSIANQLINLYKRLL